MAATLTICCRCPTLLKPRRKPRRRSAMSAISWKCPSPWKMSAVMPSFRSDGSYTHDLLPMPYTFEAAKKTAQKIRDVRDFLEVPIAVENVSSYAEFHVSEMTEWEFLNEVVERAD